MIFGVLNPEKIYH